MYDFLCCLYYRSESPQFQPVDELDVKLPDVEAGDILAVEVDDVRVGYAALSGGVEHGEILAPGRGGQRHQPVVVAGVLLHDGVGEVQREAPAF